MEPTADRGEGASTPSAVLDAIRDDPSPDEARRAGAFDLLIRRFDPDDLLDAARARLGDLSGAEAEAVLRLVEAFGGPDDLDALAGALRGQPDLPAERAWEALAVLQGAGRLDEHPDLADLWRELNEVIDEAEGSLGELAAQLEDEPSETWVSLQALGAVEPEVRAEIVAGLAEGPTGPGLVEFLRLLAFAHDPATRRAALDALGAHPADHPDVRRAWATIAEDHPDPAVVEHARRASGGMAPDPRDAPRLVGSVVTALDGEGVGDVVLAAGDRGASIAAVFRCDVRRGIVGVSGQVGPDPAAARGILEEAAARPDRDAVEGADALAVGLLAGSLLLSGPAAPPALPFWLERTVGPGFRPRPFVDDETDAGPADDADQAVAVVLDACRDWVDRSALTYDLAEELTLREGDRPPDPALDSGAFRFLFEQRLVGRLELYRRMLTWMAAFWRASGAEGLAGSASALAAQLSDPQHAVPGHPFAVALTARSLAAAQDDLRRGVDPRRPGPGSARP